MALALKLLNGPMQGRALTLPDGPLTLGLGDVDLQVAFDNGISLVTLQVNGQNVKLQHSVPCWVEGRSFTGNTLPLGKIIDLAGQGMVLLDAGESFEHRRIPERLATGRWRLSRLQKRFAVAVVFFTILAGCSVSFYWWQHQETISERVDRLGFERWLVQQHQTPALRTLGFEWLGDGTVRIYGECLKQQALNNVLQIMRNKGVFWHLEARCQDRLLEDVRDLLAQNGYQHTEVSDGYWPGEVRIRGDIHADQRWNQVTSQLADLPGLKSWTVSGTNANRTRWLEAIRKAGLLGKLNMEKQNAHLVVSGLLKASEQQRLQKELQGLLKEEHLTLIFQIIPPRNTSGENIFPLPIISVSGSKASPYLTLSDGRRLLVGSILNEGFEIAAIDPQRGVDVYRDGQLLHIPLDL